MKPMTGSSLATSWSMALSTGTCAWVRPNTRASSARWALLLGSLWRKVLSARNAWLCYATAGAERLVQSRSSVALAIAEQKNGCGAVGMGSQEVLQLGLADEAVLVGVHELRKGAPERPATQRHRRQNKTQRPRFPGLPSGIRAHLLTVAGGTTRSSHASTPAPSPSPRSLRSSCTCAPWSTAIGVRTAQPSEIS